MSNFIFQLISGGFGWVGSLIGLAMLAINIWFVIDSIRRGEYLWTVFLLFFPLLNIILYYLFVLRPSGDGNPLAGFELPGAADRKRIKQLKADIHYLDRANQHLELGDIYMSQGNMELAEQSYRAAFDRDSEDEDIRAHLGSCLARRNKAAEGLPLLEAVCAKNPKHDYGYTLMSLAEAQGAVGKVEQALATWRQVLSMYAYSRARVQYADLLIQRKEYAEARKQLQGVIDDYPFTPKFQQKKETVWLHRAQASLGKIPTST